MQPNFFFVFNSRFFKCRVQVFDSDTTRRDARRKASPENREEKLRMRSDVYILLHEGSMAQNTCDMSVDGVLTTKSAARFVTSYLLFQSCLVIFTISSYLRCMVYHVTQIDTDTSKIISISTLWEIVLWNNQNMYQGRDTGVGNDQQLPNQAWNISQGLFPSRRDAAPDADQQLKVILQSYVSRKSPALHMYSGMLDSRFVMHDEIQKYLEETVAAAFPWKLQIESLDSAILLYSLSLACIGFMYYTIYHKIMTNPTKTKAH